MRIPVKAALYTIAIATVSIVICSISIQIPSINFVDKILVKEYDKKLNSIRATLNEQLNMYFNMLFNEVIILSQSSSVIDATKQFNKDFINLDKEIKAGTMSLSYPKKELEGFEKEFNREYSYLNGGEKIEVDDYLNKANKAALKLQHDFIIHNPEDINSKDSYLGEDLNYDYAKTHSKYHDSFLAFKKNSYFYDILIVDNNGVVIYSVEKEIDLGTSLKSGPFKDTNVAALFKKVQAHGNDDVSFSDYSEYIPSFGRPSLFLGTPIYNPKTMERYGVLIVEVSLRQVDRIMSFNKGWEKIGLGKTGEAYLIDEEGFIRSDLRLFYSNRAKYLSDLSKSGYPDSDILSVASRGTAVGVQKIPTLSNVVNSTDGAGIATYTDYKDDKVISVFDTVGLPIDWNIVVQIDKKEAFAPLAAIHKELWSITIVISGIVIVLALMLGLWLGRLVTSRIINIIDVINHIVKTKDLTKRMDVNDNDEISILKKSFNQLLGTLQYTHQQTIESSKQFESLAGDLMKMADKDQVSAEESERLREAGNNIENLSSKLRNLSRNFKVFAREARRTRGW